MNKLIVLVLMSFGLQAQNVGINNTDPQTTLDINGGFRTRLVEVDASGAICFIPANASYVRLYGTNTATFNILYAAGYSNGARLVIYNNTNQSANLYGIIIPSGKTGEVIFHDGFFNLIGISSSSTGGHEIKDADGNTKVTTESISNENKVRIDLNGQERLVLDGQKIEPKNTIAGTFFGDNAGALTTGNRNTFIGNNAGSSTTATGDNTAIGASALLSNQSGENNVAVGSTALRNNQVSHNNVAVGTGAGYSATQGGNVYVGTYAGYEKNGSNSNTFVGENTGRYGNIGNDNVLIGKNAAQTLNTSNNVVIGASASSNTTGLLNDNVIIGHAAARSKGGTDNVIVGKSAAFNSTTGSQNVILGKDAGYNNSGEGNTILGYQSGLNNTGHNNVFIGRNSGADEIGNNKLYIENTNANKDNALIFGDFGADSIQINAKTIVRDQLGLKGTGDLTGISLAYNNTTRQTDAGKIQYGGFGGEDHVVNIVGGGTDPGGTDRKVKIWAEGGTEIIGEIKPNGTGGQANQVLTSNGDGTMQWAAMNSGGDGGAGAGPWSNWCTDNINEYQPVSDVNGVNGDLFGSSVSISGDYAIVGAKNDEEGGLNYTGSATIFKRNPSTGVWESQGKLTNPGAASGDEFGSSVSISGDYAIVGAPDDEEDGWIGSGSATIFKRNTSTGVWESQGKLAIASPLHDDHLGYSVSISGDYAIVGSDSDLNLEFATIFKRNTSNGVWENQGELTNPGAAYFDKFGNSVSISGDYAIVGAYRDDEGGLTDNGSATIFKRNTSTNVWESQGKLTNPSAGNEDFFGYSVSISGDYAIVGALRDDEDGFTNNGSATIFKRNPSTWIWESQGKLTNPDAESGDEFGISVSISNDYAIVGAYQADEGSGLTNNGSATVYRRYGNIWRVVQKFTNPGSANNDYFGSDVSIDGSTRRFLVGAYGVQNLTGMAFFGKVK